MQSWIGLTVAQVLASCGATYTEVRLVDEPPGKLRAVQVPCHQGEPPRRVALELRYHDGLFSAERSWSRELVEAQIVDRVLESTRDLH